MANFKFNNSSTFGSFHYSYKVPHFRAWYHNSRIFTMAPKNRIFTLKDLNGSSHTFTPPEASKGPQHAQAKSSSNIPAYQQEEPVNNPLAAKYCQPINPKDKVPLHHIPNLLSDKVCEDTFNRIHQEFLPIIQRRKFNVKSISELCCCGDGLDHTKGKRRKLRKMANNVLGYNMTRWHGRSKTHTIHLRLRNPKNHNQLFPWEDVAGTMAHELSHCVHGPHNAAFYKLMEEILEGKKKRWKKGVLNFSRLFTSKSHSDIHCDCVLHRACYITDESNGIQSWL